MQLLPEIARRLGIDMVYLKITPELLGTLGETYYKEYCLQHDWAHTSLEQIYKNPIHKKYLEFEYGFEKILVKIPSEIQKEITDISKSSNKKEENLSFAYDFLACKARQSNVLRHWKDVKSEDFRWVEVKTGYSKFSPNQINTLKKLKIPLVRCRVANVLAPPEEVKISLNELNESCLR